MDTKIEREMAAMTPAEAAKLAYGLQSYGRVEVVLSRSELNKLFAGDVSVIYCEYDQREEQLRICIEGSGLFKNWKEGQRPYNVRGSILGGSYVMMEKDSCRPISDSYFVEDEAPPWNVRHGPPCPGCGKTEYRMPNMGEHIKGRICRNCRMIIGQRPPPKEGGLQS